MAQRPSRALQKLQLQMPRHGGHSHSCDETTRSACMPTAHTLTLMGWCNLKRWCHFTCGCTHWIQQSAADFLPVAVPETRPTELTPHTHTLRVVAAGLGVSSFLPTLVASGSLWRKKIFNLWFLTTSLLLLLLLTFGSLVLEYFEVYVQQHNQ